MFAILVCVMKEYMEKSQLITRLKLIEKKNTCVSLTFSR